VSENAASRSAPADERKSAQADERRSAPADLPEEFTLTLDRTRAFAEVHGDQVEHNLGFIQDGIPFDRAGRLVRHLFEKRNAKELDGNLAASARPQVKSDSSTGTPLLMLEFAERTVRGL
jgi:hypothetical protein